MTLNKTASAGGWCDIHQKLLYYTRKEARKIARLHPEHKTPYRCQVQPDMWHIGGPHKLVLAGVKTKDEIYQRKWFA